MVIFCYLNTCIFYDVPLFRIIYRSKITQLKRSDEKPETDFLQK